MKRRRWPRRRWRPVVNPLVGPSALFQIRQRRGWDLEQVLRVVFVAWRGLRLARGVAWCYWTARVFFDIWRRFTLRILQEPHIVLAAFRANLRQSACLESDYD